MKTLTSVVKTTNHSNENSHQHINSPESMKMVVPMTPINPDKINPIDSQSGQNVVDFQNFVAQKQTSIAHFPNAILNHQTGVRLINAKFPPIDVFADVADPDEFEALYAIQSITNLQSKNEKGSLNLLAKEKIPSGITGCHYACTPFTDMTPDGSRFSNGQFGIMYIADCVETAMAEACFHQCKAWQNIEGLHFDSIVLRQLNVTFSADLIDITQLCDSPLYHNEDYNAARELGSTVYHLGHQGIQFLSVRRQGHTCWALMTPQYIEKIEQSHHYELIFDGKNISNIRKISNFEY